MILMQPSHRAGWDESKHPRNPQGKFVGKSQLRVPGVETTWTKGRRKGISHNTLVAKLHGQRAGYIRMTDEGREVDELYIAPGARGKGIAHQLLGEAIERYGNQTIRLHASPFGKGGPDSGGLQRLYAQHGFEPDPSLGGTYMIRRPDRQQGRANGVAGEQRKRKGRDNGELKEYWTQDPEGLAKWKNKPHPWTALYHELKEHIENDALAKATASAWYKTVFGHMPNQKDKKGRSGGPSGEQRASVTDAPWNGNASRFTPEQWRRSCLIDTGEGDAESKSRYKLPVREPDGTLNRNACHAAASALDGGRGGVQATEDQIRSAKRKLASLYRNQLDEDPPKGLTGGQRINTPGFLTGVDGFTKGKGDVAGKNTLAECMVELKQAMAEGDQARIDSLKDKITKLKAGGRTQEPDADERAKFGEGPGGSQKGISLKALKAQLKQAMADGDTELAAKLRTKIAEVSRPQGNSDNPSGDERKWNPSKHPRDGDSGGGGSYRPSGGGSRDDAIDKMDSILDDPADRDEEEMASSIVNKLRDGRDEDLTEDEKDFIDLKLAEDEEFDDRDEDERDARPATERSVMRTLPVIRSAYGPSTSPALADRPSEAEGDQAPGGGVFVRASYRAGRDGEASDVMTLRFSAFNNWYEIDSAREGRFLERVAPGAFTKTIGERGGQIKVLFNHGHDAQIGEKVLGKIITLEERKDGAYAEIELFDTSYNRDLLPGLRSGAYGSSFMFNVMDDSWEDRPERSESNPNGLPERTVRALRLLELGPVTWPANPSATAGMRSDTDTYCDGLRANRPETYNNVEERFAEFRSALARTSVDGEAAARTSRNGKAATRCNAPVGTDHAGTPTANNAETRRARLKFNGVIEE